MPKSVFQSALNDLKTRIAETPKGEQIPTIRELEAELGVGRSTVQQVIKQLGREGVVESYVGRGTFVASGAKTNRKQRNITILRCDYPSRSAHEKVASIYRGLTGRGYAAMVLNYSKLDHALDVVRAVPAADAYVFQPSSPQIPVSLLAFLRRRCRTVVVEGAKLEDLDVDALTANDLEIFSLAMRRLLDLGHRRIAFACGQPEAGLLPDVALFRLFHQWAGLPNDPDPVILSDTLRGESPTPHIQKTMAELIARHNGRLPFTAVVVSTYASALGVFGALEEAGLAVPADVSLVVLDNPDLHSEQAQRFTMVGRTCRRTAERVLEMIEWRWEHPDAPYRTVYEKPELAIRDSTGPPGKLDSG